MIKNLLNFLFWPNFGAFAETLCGGLREGALPAGGISDLTEALHKLTLCSYYGAPDDEFKMIGNDEYRHWDPRDLCERGAAFLLLCLEKMAADGAASKDGPLVTLGGCVLDMRETKERLARTAEKMGDEDGLTFGWISLIDRFISRTPEEGSSFCFRLLDKMESSNAAVVFDFCARSYTQYGGSCTPEMLKERQSVFPEDFCTMAEIWEYYAKHMHADLCYFFLERADIFETSMYGYASDKVEKAQSLRELLLALAEEEVYLWSDNWNGNKIFPYTVYRLLTEESYEVCLKKI